MTLKITTDDLNISIGFEGSTTDGDFTDPAVLLSRNVGIITAGNNLHIVDSLRSASKGTTSYYMYGVPYTEFLDHNGNNFNSASECYDYIANIISPKRNIVTLDGTRMDFSIDGASITLSVAGIGSTTLNLS